MDYERKFTHLRRNKNPTRWAARTCYRAPHKPLMLLSILDLIEQGIIQQNRIRLDAELIDAFARYWFAVMGNEKHGSPVLPFYHLKSDGFWRLIAVPGREEVLEFAGKIHTFNKLQALVDCACLDEILFELLKDETERERFRHLLITTYFDSELQQKLFEVREITEASYRYAQELVEKTNTRFKLEEHPEEPQDYYPEYRSAAFRRIVVRAYDYTCAMCGVRLVTPEGRTAVVAAHIKPWHLSHNDDPRNGLALCGLHHWTFDEGLVCVVEDYRLSVSPLVSSIRENTDGLALLPNETLILPEEKQLSPSKRALDWHQRNVFRGDIERGLF